MRLGNGSTVRVISNGTLQNVVGTVYKTLWYRDDKGSRIVCHVKLGKGGRQTFASDELEVVCQ